MSVHEHFSLPTTPIRSYLCLVLPALPASPCPPPCVLGTPGSPPCPLPVCWAHLPALPAPLPVCAPSCPVCRDRWCFTWGSQHSLPALAGFPWPGLQERRESSSKGPSLGQADGPGCSCKHLVLSPADTRRVRQLWVESSLKIQNYIIPAHPWAQPLAGMGQSLAGKCKQLRLSLWQPPLPSACACLTHTGPCCSSGVTAPLTPAASGQMRFDTGSPGPLERKSRGEEEEEQEDAFGFFFYLPSITGGQMWQTHSLSHQEIKWGKE